MSYIFGGDTGMSYEDIQRKRKIVERLLSEGSAAPRNVGEGLHAVGRALMARGMEKRASKAEDKLRQDFEGQFSQVAPQGAGPLADLYDHPMAGAGQKKVLAALMKGAPGYRRGTMSAQGGPAVVGENGPEVVNLPRGAQVMPNELLQLAQMLIPQGMGDDPQGQGGMMFDTGPNRPGGPVDGISQPPEPDEYLLQELGPEMFQRYQQMAPEQRMDFMNDPANGFVAPPPEMDPRGMFDQEDAMGLKPQGNFAPGQEYQTADIDAFKMMQLQPEYETPVDADINTTEGSRISLLRRMMFADAALEDPRLPKAMSRMDNAFAGRLGALGKMYTDDDYELGKLMSEQFANAVLRNDSGAAAPDSEVRRYASQYFPQANDSEGQIQAKKALRREVIRSMAQALGGDASPVMQQIMQEMDMLKQQADVPEEGEISAEDKDFLKSLGLE